MHISECRFDCPTCIRSGHAQISCMLGWRQSRCPGHFLLFLEKSLRTRLVHGIWHIKSRRGEMQTHSFTVQAFTDVRTKYSLKQNVGNLDNVDSTSCRVPN